MDRIEIIYNKKHNPILEVVNDIKGLSRRVIVRVEGNDARLLYKILRKVDYKKIKDIDSYTFYIIKKEDRK